MKENIHVNYSSIAATIFSLINFSILIIIQKTWFVVVSSFATAATEDPITYELAQLVLRSDKVRIRTMHELEEAEQDDLIMPNKWVYHKNSDLNEVLNYIRNVYDGFRIEDEIDEHHNLS